MESIADAADPIIHWVTLGVLLELKDLMKILIYTTQICPYCTAAKQLLSSKALPFDEIKVDNNPYLRAEMERLSGQNTVPQIWISGSHVGGYTDLVAYNRSGRLDAMLDD